jgi:hypothetical protein
VAARSAGQRRVRGVLRPMWGPDIQIFSRAPRDTCSFCMSYVSPSHEQPRITVSSRLVPGVPRQQQASRALQSRARIPIFPALRAGASSAVPALFEYVVAGAQPRQWMALDCGVYCSLSGTSPSWKRTPEPQISCAARCLQPAPFPRFLNL